MCTEFSILPRGRGLGMVYCLHPQRLLFHTLLGLNPVYYHLQPNPLMLQLKLDTSKSFHWKQSREESPLSCRIKMGSGFLVWRGLNKGVLSSSGQCSWHSSKMNALLRPRGAAFRASWGGHRAKKCGQDAVGYLKTWPN